ncbi:MAG: endonuclease/exonuclease/phosphatase family protein [Anaerolineae bacterium]|nr:endonuclease/exonuclease/phosphatase family protein [Anaerolineae bacterium]
MLNLFTLFFKKVVGLICYLFWLGSWLLGIGLILWYPLRWWPGDKLPPVQLLNYFMAWLLLALIPALAAAGLTRRKWLATLLAIPTILIISNYAPLFLPRGNPVLAHSGQLKVMSYNIYWRNSNNLQNITDIIRREQPDILLVQEAYDSLSYSLTQELETLYPGQELYYTFSSRAGQGIISRFPLTPLDFSYEQGRAQKAIVHTPNGDIQVWNVHLRQPLRWSRQYQQMVNLVDAVAAVDQPLIIGGDFNTNDQSEIYGMLNQYLENAHWEAGWGFGFTFPSQDRPVKGVSLPAPLVRIDHIFHSNHFYASEAKTLPDGGGSDHLPVVAELSFIK